MFGDTSPIIFTAMLLTAAALIVWLLSFRRARRRGPSRWADDEAPVVVAEMPRVDLLEYPYSVALILGPDAPLALSLADAPRIRVSSPLTSDGIRAFARIDLPRGPSRYAFLVTRAVGIDDGMLRARVRFFDVDASAPGRAPRGYPGDEDLFVYRSDADVVAPELGPQPSAATPPEPPAPPAPPTPPPPRDPLTPPDPEPYRP